MSDQKVIRFSQPSLPDCTRTSPLKIRGEVTFTKPSSLSRGPSIARTIPAALIQRLQRFDADQLHIVMVVVAAIERGAP